MDVTQWSVVVFGVRDALEFGRVLKIKAQGS
jgi:hypothetical protein